MFVGVFSTGFTRGYSYLSPSGLCFLIVFCCDNAGISGVAAVLRCATLLKCGTSLRRSDNAALSGLRVSIDLFL